MKMDDVAYINNVDKRCLFHLLYSSIKPSVQSFGDLIENTANAPVNDSDNGLFYPEICHLIILVFGTIRLPDVQNK
jgi:hypothetical protein